MPMGNSSLQFTESPHIQISTCTGTATTTSQTNTVSTTHSHTGLSVFVPTNSYWNKKTNTSIWHSAGATTLTGFSTSSKQKWTYNSVNNNGTTTPNFTGTQTKTTPFSQWSHNPKGSVKVLETYVGKWEYRYISRVPTQSRNYW